MTDLKEVIEIGLNSQYSKPRFEVSSIEVGRTMITVNYQDHLLEKKDFCQFSL